MNLNLLKNNNNNNNNNNKNYPISLSKNHTRENYPIYLSKNHTRENYPISLSKNHTRENYPISLSDYRASESGSPRPKVVVVGISSLCKEFNLGSYHRSQAYQSEKRKDGLKRTSVVSKGNCQS
jgi:hypothetical protein